MHTPEKEQEKVSVPIYKIELYVVALNDEYGVEDIKYRINNEFDSEGVIFGKIERKVVKDYNDEHNLNLIGKDLYAARKIFKKLKGVDVTRIKIKK